jgi:hypothetical protein
MKKLTNDQILWLLTARCKGGGLLQDVSSSLSDLCLQEDLVQNGDGTEEFILTIHGSVVWGELQRLRQLLRKQTAHVGANANDLV